MLVGPSGCGKSTTLRMITGLDDPTEGEIYIDGQKVNDVTPGKRDIAMVFQNYALYPTMTVRQNISFGLENKKVPKEERDRRVKEICEIVGLNGLPGPQALQAFRRPETESRPRPGHGKAAEGIPDGRALVKPGCKAEGADEVELIQLHKNLGTTFVYVTHDQTEAMSMADTIVLMKDGYIVQQSSPESCTTIPTASMRHSLLARLR